MVVNIFDETFWKIYIIILLLVKISVNFSEFRSISELVSVNQINKII